MEIRIKVGSVEVYYAQRMPESNYPAIISADRDGDKRKSDVFLSAIEGIIAACAKANMEIESVKPKE